MMAYPARTVNYVYVDPKRKIVMANVGDDIRVDVLRLPRQDLRRVCSFLGVGGDATKTNEQLKDDIVKHVSDVTNVADGGMILRRNDSVAWISLVSIIEDTVRRISNV